MGPLYLSCRLGRCIPVCVYTRVSIALHGLFSGLYLRAHVSILLFVLFCVWEKRIAFKAKTILAIPTSKQKWTLRLGIVIVIFAWRVCAKLFERIAVNGWCVYGSEKTSRNDFE